MRICILSIVNVKHMSLISLYTSYFDKYSIDYDIIYIDKYEEQEYTTAKRMYRYPIKINRDWNKLKKLSFYWGFKRFAENIIDKNKYDYIVVWKTETALMFADYLIRKMKDRYCVNVRDYCMENNSLVFHRVKKAIQNANFTTVSSEGFKGFLPSNEYVTIHSYNKEVLSKCKPKNRLKKAGDPINICFIGYVRFFETDKKLIDALGNDPRYLIQYFGEGSQYLEEYAREKQISNVEFHKGFKVEETSKFLERADVINNLYGYNDIALETAISIKYYYAISMNIPILVFKGTYMEQISLKLGIGFAVDKHFDTLADDFYAWYHSIDYGTLKNQCNKELDEINNTNKLFNKLLENTFVNDRTGRVKNEN